MKFIIVRPEHRHVVGDGDSGVEAGVDDHPPDARSPAKHPDRFGKLAQPIQDFFPAATVTACAAGEAMGGENLGKDLILPMHVFLVEISDITKVPKTPHAEVVHGHSAHRLVVGRDAREVNSRQLDRRNIDDWDSEGFQFIGELGGCDPCDDAVAVPATGDLSYLIRPAWFNLDMPWAMFPGIRKDARDDSPPP